MYDVVAVGELLIDFTPIQGASSPSFAQNPGGAPANVLVSAARMGKRTAFIGKVGDDPFGRFLRQTLVEHDVNADGLLVTPEYPTTLAFVHLDASGERTFSFYRHPGADVMLSPDEVETASIRNARVFHFGSVSLTHDPSRSATRRAVQAAKESGSIITFDPNVRLSLWDSPEDAKAQILSAMKYANVVKVSEEELEILAGDGDAESASERLEDGDIDSAPATLVSGGNDIESASARLMKENGNLELVLVTLGAKGCYYRAAWGHGMVPGFSVKSVDTTGAGDGFMGAFIAGLLDTGKRPEDLRDEQMQALLRVANASGALTTTKPGGIPALPSRQQVLEFIGENQ